MRVRELNQLFDSLDPSPLFEKDLDARAEEYIVARMREISPGKATGLVVHLDRPGESPEQERIAAEAIRDHFARESLRLQRSLGRLIRRGFISLLIGLAFLGAAFLLSEAIRHLLGERHLMGLFEQGLLIVGWVAMWRPLEIFLYDWWPIVGERRIHDQLSRIPVTIAG